MGNDNVGGDICRLKRPRDLRVCQGALRLIRYGHVSNRRLGASLGASVAPCIARVAPLAETRNSSPRCQNGNLLRFFLPHGIANLRYLLK